MIPKFRFWDIDEKHFIKDATIVLNQDGSIEGIEYFHSKLGHSVYNDISYYELLQSTGLKDKHGTEIFEGDIIDKGYHNLSIEHRIGCVELSAGGDSDGYFHGEWLGWITNNNDSLLDVHRYCTVLGNKYEHPHLLEE